MASLAQGILLKNEDKNDKSEMRLAPQGTLKLFVHMEARTKVHIRVMNILSYEGDSVLKDITGGVFTMEGKITYERRFFFKANGIKPYYQDAMVFSGIGGEYTVFKNINDKNSKGGISNKSKEIQNEPKKFILIPHDSYVSEPEPIF